MTAIDRLPVAFFRARIEAPFELRPEYVSEGVAAVTGYSQEAVMSGEAQLHWEIGGDEHGPFVQSMRESFLDEGSFDRTVQLRDRDGQLRWLRVHATALRDAHGTPVAVEGFAVNVTDFKRAESALDTQRRESLGMLARGIAHDFNNLLLGIRGNAEILKMVLPADAPARRHIDAIELTAQRATELTQLLHAYGGNSAIRLESVDLTALVRDMLAMLEPTLRDGVSFERQLSAEVPSIPGDATQIRQLVLNLTVNAIQAMRPDGGVVWVSTNKITVLLGDEPTGFLPATPAPGTYVSITVYDDGVGMEKSVLQRIFDPFFTTRPNGKGLGLMTVLGVVRAHRGVVRVNSELGHGTSFQVLLPCVRSPSIVVPRVP